MYIGEIVWIMRDGAEPFQAKVMVSVDGWTMLRRPHARPFVERSNDIAAWQMQHAKNEIDALINGITGA